MYAVTGRDAKIAGQSRPANSTTTSLEARSVQRHRNLEDQTLRLLGLLVLQPQCRRKGRSPYTTKRNPTSTGLCLSSQRHGSQGGNHIYTRPHAAAKIGDGVLQQRCRPIDPDLLLRLGYGCIGFVRHVRHLFKDVRIIHVRDQLSFTYGM